MNKPEPSVHSSDLLKSAREMSDAEETMYKAEVFLMRKIAETSSDLVKARWSEEFRDACGGMDALENSHAEAVVAWETYLNESEG